MERKYNNDLDDKQRLWAEENKKTVDRLIAQLNEVRATVNARDTEIVQLKTEHTKNLNEAIRKFDEWKSQATKAHFA